MRAIIAMLAFFAVFVQSASAQDYFFRYRHGHIESPIQPETPSQPEDQTQYDIEAIFISFVGESGSYQIPLKPGNFASTWTIENGHLPSGLNLDTNTGRISGTPTGRGNTTAGIVALSADGTELSNARVRFNVVEPKTGSAEFTAYAHSDRYFETRIAAQNEVYTWESVIPLPSWATASGSLLRGTPPAGLEGIFSFAIQGRNYAGEETKFVHGKIIVNQGPVVGSIPDGIYDPHSNLTISAHAENTSGKLVWRLEGDPLPAGLYLDQVNGRIQGAFNTFSTSASMRFVAMDSNGTTGYSNTFRLSSRDPALSLNGVNDRTLYVNVPTSFKLEASELTGVPEWEIASGSLPEGIILDATSGIISGEPQKSGVYDGISVSVSTNTGYSATSSEFTITVLESPITATVDRTQARISSFFSTPMPRVTDAFSPYTYSLANGQVLDPSLTLNTSTGEISGTLGMAGNKTVMLEVMDSRGTLSNPFAVSIQAYNPLGISVHPETVTLVRTLTDADIEPVLVSNSLIETESDIASYTLAGSLPFGLTFNAYNGKITGKALVEGVFGPLQISVTDGSKTTAHSNNFNIQVDEKAPITVEVLKNEFPAYSLINTRLGQAVNHVGETRWSLTSGTLPNGITLSPDGYITGKPLEQGIFPNIVISVSDDEGAVASSMPFQIEITPPDDLEVTTNLIELPINRAANATLVSKNFAENVIYSIVSGVLPSGLTLSPDGKITGTASTPSDNTLTINARDALGRSVDKSIRILIKSELSISLDSTYTVARGGVVHIVPSVSNVIGTPQFSISGNLLQGLEFNGTSGEITGQVNSQGETGLLTITVADSAGSVATASTQIKIGPREPLRIAYAISDKLKVNSSIGLPIRPLEPTNALSTVTYRVTGNLPGGMTFDNSNGWFQGTPQQSGTFGGIYVFGRDGTDPEVRSEEIQIVVAPAEQFSARNHIVIGREGAYFTSTEPDVRGAVGNLKFTAVPASPLGLILNSSTGSFAGIPTGIGSTVAKMSVEDSLGRKLEYTTTIKAVGSLSVSYPATATNIHSSVSIAPVTENAIGSVNYQIATGTLPSGLTLNAQTGVISGKPNAQGNFALVVAVEDEGFTNNTASSNSFQVTVGNRLPLEISTPENQGVIANKKFTLSLAAKNTVGNVNWSITEGLPSGLSMNSEGVISGTASALGSYTVTVTAGDEGSGSTSKSLTFVVTTNGLPIQLSNYNVKTKVGREFSSAAPFVTNTVGDHLFYSDNIESLGLTLDPATGIVSGRYDNPASIVGNINVTDSSNRVTSMPISIEVIPNMIVSMREQVNITASTLMQSVRPTIEYSIGAVKYELVGPALPTGLTFSKSTGLISGTPTQLGTFTGYFIEATDEYGDIQLSNEFSINVYPNGTLPRVNVTVTNTWASHTTSVRSITPTATPKKTGDVYSINKTLPGKMEINPTTGVISGILDLDAVGLHDGFVVSLEDTAGNIAHSNEFSIIVTSNPTLRYTIPTISIRRGVPFMSEPPVVSAGRAAGDVVFAAPTMPNYLTINPITGVISGIIPFNFAPKTLSVNFNSRDEVSNYSSTTMLEIVNLGVKYNTTTSTGAAGVPIAQRVPDITNSVGTVRFRWQEGHEVPDVHLDPETGVISGHLPYGAYTNRLVVIEDDLESITVAHSFTGNNPPGEFLHATINTTDIAPGTWVVSDPIHIGGIRAPVSAPIVRSATYRYRICETSSCDGVEWSANIATYQTVPVSPGNYIQFQILSSTTLSGSAYVDLSVNGSSFRWNVVTRAKSETIDYIDLGPDHSVSPSDMNPIIIQATGFLDQATVKLVHSGLSGVGYRVCNTFEECELTGVNYVANGHTFTVSPGQFIKLNYIARPEHLRQGYLQLTQVANGVTRDVTSRLNINTRALSNRIDSVYLGEDVLGTERSTEIIRTVQMTGFLDPAPFYLSYTNMSVNYRLCDDLSTCDLESWRYEASGRNINAQPNQYLQVKILASSSFNTVGRLTIYQNSPLKEVSNILTVSTRPQ